MPSSAKEYHSNFWPQPTDSPEVEELPMVNEISTPAQDFPAFDLSEEIDIVLSIKTSPTGEQEQSLETPASPASASPPNQSNFWRQPTDSPKAEKLPMVKEIMTTDQVIPAYESTEEFDLSIKTSPTDEPETKISPSSVKASYSLHRNFWLRQQDSPKAEELQKVRKNYLIKGLEMLMKTSNVWEMNITFLALNLISQQAYLSHVSP